MAEIKTLTEVICKNCGNTFKYYPSSTIKPKYCFRCQNKRDSERRKENNIKLLQQSTFSRNGYKSKPNTNKYATKAKGGNKQLKTPRQRAMDNADLWFSRYIRIKYHYKIVNGEVFCQCIVNPNVIKHAKNMDNGHCFSRDFKPTRYEEDNCRPQNRSSNRFSGEADHYKFRDALEKQIGEERFNRLDHLRKQEGEDTEEFYKAQAYKYRILTNQLVDQYDVIKWW